MEVSLIMDQNKENLTETEKVQTSEAHSETSMTENTVTDVKNQVNDLQGALIDKAAELESLHEIALEQEKKFAAETESLKSQVDELRKALEIATKEKEEAVSELVKIKEEALLNERLTRLQEAKLLRSGEEASVKQAEKVKKMSDADFDEYVSELSDIKGQTTSSDTKNAEEHSNNLVDQIVKTARSASITDEVKKELQQVVDKLVTNDKPIVASESLVKETETPKESAASKTNVSVEELAKGFSNIVNIYNKGRK